MSHLISILSTALSFIIIISAIVFIHEFGHYIVAKWAGVKIDIFSIGFGRELFGWNDRSGTRWRIAALPLGGYVRMYGDASEASTPLEAIADLPTEEKEKTFYYKPLHKKAAIVVAGPLANFILTIIIMTVFITTRGVYSTEPVVGEILKDTPAEAAGLMPGDRILTVSGEKVEIFNDISRIIYTNLGTPVTLTLQRGDKDVSVTLIPKQVTEKDSLGNDFTRPLIGFSTKKITYKEVGPVNAVWEATVYTYHICTTTLHAVWQMIMGDRSPKELQGPIGIAMLSGQAAEKGLYSIFMLIAMISANLGLVNLFPVPMLDGGHLLYYAIEAVQRKPLSKRYQEYGFRLGMAMVVMLMLLAFKNDIVYRVIPKLAHVFTS